MNKKLFLLIISFLILTTPKALAVNIPSFPSCSSPQGTIKVQYEQGIHGIVGNTSEYKGSDFVYSLSDLTLMQCFCSEDGSGIQTNWWKVTSLTDEEIQILKNEGWYLVPNGQLWGLSEGAYMAKNSNYSCKSGGGTGGGSVTTSVDTTDHNSPGTPPGNTGGVLSGIGQILALAFMGNKIFLYLVIATGFIFLLIGIVLRKNVKK